MMIKWVISKRERGGYWRRQQNNVYKEVARILNENFVLKITWEMTITFIYASSKEAPVCWNTYSYTSYISPSSRTVDNTFNKKTVGADGHVAYTGFKFVHNTENL